MKNLTQKISALFFIVGLAAIVALFLMPIDDEEVRNMTPFLTDSKRAEPNPIELTGEVRNREKEEPEVVEIPEDTKSANGPDPKLYRIIGRVVNSKGKGLAGVQLKFTKHGNIIILDNAGRIKIREEDVAERAKTGVEGRFALEKTSKPSLSYMGIKGQLTYELKSFSLPEFGEGKRLIDLGDIELKDALVIRGRVLDPMGIGIAGATVRFDKMNSAGGLASLRFRFESYLSWEDLIGDQPIRTVRQGAELNSDEAGNFVFGHLDAGNYTFSATLAGYRKSERVKVSLLDEHSAEVSLGLRNLVTIQILTQDQQGRAVKGAKVTLADDLAERSTPTPTYLSNERGLAIFEEVGGEEHILTIIKEGFVAVRESINLSSESQQQKTFVLFPEVIARGKVVSRRTGKGVEANISAFIKGQEKRSHTEIRTKVTGEFELPQIAPGLYSLTVVAKGHVVERREWQVPEGTRVIELPPIQVDPLVSVELLVLDSDGIPVEDAKGRASEIGFLDLPIVSGNIIISSDELSSLTNGEGRLTLKNVVPGMVSFSVEKDGYPTAYADSVIVSNSGTKVTLRFLKNGGELKGHCFDKMGQKLKRGEIAIARRGFKRIAQVAKIKSDGSYQFPVLSPGFYRLISYKDDPKTVFEDGSAYFEVKAGVTTWDYHEPE